MLNRLALSALLIFPFGLAAHAQPGPASKLVSRTLPGQAIAVSRTPWETLANLGGAWRIAVPRTAAEKAFRIRMRPISRTTALLETFGNPAGVTTETVYHRAGGNIMATHYCAQGNQPRLLLSSTSTPSRLSFNFHDITNLGTKADSHLVKIEFNVIDDDHLERRETYTQNGIDEETTLRLKRVW